MKNNREIKVGIGFATGRKSFQNVLRTNIHSWNESGLVEDKLISLNLFIAYDLTYQKTKIADFNIIDPGLIDQIDSFTMIGKVSIDNEMDYLIKEGVLTAKEARMIFNKGYAGQRNAILYNAIKNKMNYLIFMDDDEYPLAVTHNNKTAIWSGQDILSTHLNFIKEADVTHGHHCGYISPVPYMEFNDVMSESDFRLFIEAISNDILNWDSLKKVMDNGGVTFADTEILKSDRAVEVEEINQAKFISGGNLCINLMNPKRVFPFYNPPGARGEDTFLSVCFKERRVLRVPCYTFHDGFSQYNYLLDGVLPRKLKFIRGDNAQIKNRFYKACIGWIRYKPLLLYLTQPENYAQKIEEMKNKIQEVLPKINAYFQVTDFNNVLTELKIYDEKVEMHYRAFMETQRIWAKIMEHFAKD